MSTKSNPEEIFYTIDDEIAANIDAQTIYKDIIAKYPIFIHSSPSIVVKRLFMTLIRDREFMIELFDKFELNIEKFISMIYKEYGYIFTPYYVNKIKIAIEEMNYV